MPGNAMMQGRAAELIIRTDMVLLHSVDSTLGYLACPEVPAEVAAIWPRPMSPLVSSTHLPQLLFLLP